MKGRGVAKGISSFQESVKKGIQKLTTSDGDINTGYLLKKIARVLAAAVVMWGAHLVGSHINGRIDQHMRKAEEERRQRIQSSGDDVDEDDVSFRSRNTMAQLGGTIAYVLSLVVGFLIVLRVLGVEVATIVALLSTIGFAIGFAVQGTLSDIAAGILLALFQTYEVGDIIRLNDHEGRVIDFRIINTLIQDLDTLTLLTVPNRIIQDSVVTNYSRSYFHIYQFFIAISNRQDDDDLSVERILELIREDLKDEEKYSLILRRNGLESSVSVDSMDQPGTRISIKVYFTADSIDSGRGQVRTGIRKLLDENDIKLREET